MVIQVLNSKYFYVPLF